MPNQKTAKPPPEQERTKTGRKPTCLCGRCNICQSRARTRKYRNHRRLLGPDISQEALDRVQVPGMLPREVPAELKWSEAAAKLIQMSQRLRRVVSMQAQQNIAIEIEKIGQAMLERESL